LTLTQTQGSKDTLYWLSSSRGEARSRANSEQFAVQTIVVKQLKQTTAKWNSM